MIGEEKRDWWQKNVSEYFSDVIRIEENDLTGDLTVKGRREVN